MFYHMAEFQQIKRKPIGVGSRSGSPGRWDIEIAKEIVIGMAV